MSTPIFDLDVTEDYQDMPILRETDVYLMEAFVEGGFRNADLKSLNFVRKYLQAVTLADIATADGRRISHHSYKGFEGNGLHKDLVWPKVPTKEQMPKSFITLWKSTLTKCFIDQASGIQRCIAPGLTLGNWFDQDVGKKWKWWLVQGESRIYRRNDNSWTFYRQFRRRYYLDEDTQTCPGPEAMPVSVAPLTSICIVTEGHSRNFVLLSPINSLSDFEANSEWSNLSEGFDYPLNNKTVLLDRFFPPKDMCNSLVEAIRNGTASIVSDGTYERNSSIGQARTSAVILEPSTTCQPRHWAKGENWVTGPEES